jgi:acetylornithine deacetylase/succinyl-diaminopimelate desuccinylase-like protein
VLYLREQGSDRGRGSVRKGALDALERRFEQTLAELIELARIPSVSAPGFDPSEVGRSAEHVAALLEESGLRQVEVLKIDGAHPYVVGEWAEAGPDAPTALLYAHHDVQPPGRVDRWKTPPFEPCERGDGRIYGRGIVDDKAGVMVHVAAIRAWLESSRALPINVRVLVEGEEEIGSPHLARFLETHRERLDADVLVLSDTANVDTGIPALTTSLRGLVNVDVTVRALSRPLHSGMWGGALPEAASALVCLLARLVDERGAPAVPGLLDDVPTPGELELEALDALPLDEKETREKSGLLSSASFVGDPSRSIRERVWWHPAIAVIALEAAPLAEAANQLLPEASARVGVRIAPGQDPERVKDCLVAFLRKDPPWGVEVETQVRAVASGWRTRPEGPAFDAARRALKAGYGREPVEVGCGGSIPFVLPLAEVLGGPPALLLGLEDPVCNAHGENESLDLGDFRKSARATVHLLEELRSVPRRGEPTR